MKLKLIAGLLGVASFSVLADFSLNKLVSGDGLYHH